MKYWKGNPKTIKNGDYGTMDNTGYVPDSVEITKDEYDDYILTQPPPKPEPESDINKLVQYAKKQKWI